MRTDAEMGRGQDRNKPGLLRVMKATENAIENLAEAATGTALLLDELENIKDKKTLGQVIMTLAGGQGRSRQKVTGELRRTASWATFYAMSAEDPARKIVQEGGGKWLAGLTARLVDVDCNDAKAVDASDLKRWRSELAKNWGHAGPMFVRHLLVSGAVDDAQALSERITVKAAEIATGADGNPVLIRAAEVFAILALAGELAEEAGVIDLRAAEAIAQAVASAWARFVVSHDAAASDPKAEAVANLITALNARRGLDVLPVDPPTDRDGNALRSYREAVAWYDDDSMIYVRADKFEELAKARISGAAVLKQLESMKAVAFERGDRRKCRNVPGIGAVDHYRLRGEVLGFASDAPESDEWAEIEDAEGPPKRGNIEKLTAFAKTYKRVGRPSPFS